MAITAPCPACQAASITSSVAASVPTGVPASARRASMARKRVGELAVGGAQQRLGIDDRACGPGSTTANSRSPISSATCVAIAAGQRVADLGRLLVDLLEHLRRRRPFEADLGGLGGDPRRRAAAPAAPSGTPSIGAGRSRPFSARSATLIASHCVCTASGVVTSAVPASGANTCG